MNRKSKRKRNAEGETILERPPDGYVRISTEAFGEFVEIPYDLLPAAQALLGKFSMCLGLCEPSEEHPTGFATVLRYKG